MTINSVPYEVIGVLTSAGSDSTTNLDDQAIVPFSTASQRIVGGTNRTLGADDLRQGGVAATGCRAAYQEANAILQYRHAITSASTSDFSITTQQSVISTTSSVDNTLTNLLIGIAALSLDRRRHRGHEHHAGLGQGTYPRDRAAQGTRRHARR